MGEKRNTLSSKNHKPFVLRLVFTPLLGVPLGDLSSDPDMVNAWTIRVRLLALFWC